MLDRILPPNHRSKTPGKLIKNSQYLLSFLADHAINFWTDQIQSLILWTFFGVIIDSLSLKKF